MPVGGGVRVVASPRPIRIVEERAIKTLPREDFVVIIGGGGGIPVVTDANGDLVGVPAAIDKDFASSLLATLVRADVFMITTPVDRVAFNWGKPHQESVDRLTLDEARPHRGGHPARGVAQSLPPGAVPSSCRRCHSQCQNAS